MADTLQLNKLTIKESLEGLQKKEFSAVELTQACLDKIDVVDKDLNTFITVTGKQALKQADGADKLIAEEGESAFLKKPLLGIPVGFKDIFSTKGVETTAASNILKGYVPPYNATVVDKLYNAGAVGIGKLNCDAFAHGAFGENSDFGPTKNPWDLERVSGGSSSGSGASVASDELIFAMGTDTGGSVRAPASFCGVVGLKPTYGRVSRYGVIAMASSFDCVGHITKTVEDSVLVLSATAGLDSLDSTTSPQSVKNYTKLLQGGVKGLKIGLPKEYFGKGLDKEVKKIVINASKILESLGAELVEVSLPNTEYGVAVYYILQPSEVSANLARFDGIRFGHSRDKFGLEAKRRIMLGTYALSAGYYDEYYLKAQKVRTLVIQDFEKVFQQVDVILGPTMPYPATKVGEVTNPLQTYMADVYTVFANLAGLPAISVPSGFTKQTLPVGFQLVAPHFEEALLFKVASTYEQETNWKDKQQKL